VLVAAFVSAAVLDRPAVRRVAYGTAVVAGWSIVISAPRAGMLPILLVVIAALGAEVVRLPVNLARADRVARTVLAGVRTTIDALRAEPAADLAETLRGVGRDIPGLDVTVEVGDDVEADEEQTAALVRTVQEIVTNTPRHARARELCVTVIRDGDVIRLTATDDGRGAAEVIPGNGLRGIAERFAALGGHVAYDGGSGFRVAARMPVRCPGASK
jgi:signal transduction histidine kinase